MERRFLQIMVFVLGWVPVLAGAQGVLQGALMAGALDAEVSLDSHVRYLSGLLLAIGVGFWSTIPNIELCAARFRMLTAIVFVGGLARLGGVVFNAWPSEAMVFGLGMELVIVPLLCFWQNRIKATL